MDAEQLIKQFLDAIWVEQGLSKNTLSAYASDLHIYARWMAGRKLLEVDNTEVENSVDVGYALDWCECGADFADALHLAVCGTAVMHTFDQGFCKTAREAGVTPSIVVLVE